MAPYPARECFLSFCGHMPTYAARECFNLFVDLYQGSLKRHFLENGDSYKKGWCEDTDVLLLLHSSALALHLFLFARTKKKQKLCAAQTFQSIICLATRDAKP